MRGLVPVLCALFALLLASPARADCTEYKDDDARHFCFAMTTGHSSHCIDIVNRDVKLFCIALATQAIRACASIGDANLRARCRSATASDDDGRGTEETDCEQITDDGYRKFCQAQREKSETYCTNIRDNNDLRLYCMALLNGNPALCATIESYDTKLRCRMSIKYGTDENEQTDKPAVSGVEGQNGEVDDSTTKKTELASLSREEAVEDGDMAVDDATGHQHGSDSAIKEVVAITWDQFFQLDKLPGSDCNPYKPIADMWRICMAMRGSGDRNIAYCEKIKGSTMRHRHDLCEALLAPDDAYEDKCKVFAEHRRRIGDVTPSHLYKVCRVWARRDR